MSDEQKIEGVPDGQRIARLIKHDSHGISFEAILEPIPKPKQSVIVAEWDVTKGLGFTAPRVYIGGIHRNCDRFRVEERDEPRNEEPKPKRHILMAEAEVPPDFRIEDGGAIVAYRSGTGVSLDIHRFNAEVFRIEERDA